MLLTISYSESAYPITPVVTLKPCFWDNSVFVYILVVNNNKYLSYVVDNIIFGISVPDYPSRTVETNSLRIFWNFCISCLLYIHINNNKFTYNNIINLHKHKSSFNLFYNCSFAINKVLIILTN